MGGFDSHTPLPLIFSGLVTHDGTALLFAALSLALIRLLTCLTCVLEVSQYVKNIAELVEGLILDALDAMDSARSQAAVLPLAYQISIGGRRDPKIEPHAV